MRVCKIFRFDAAHFLPGYDGACASVHGHSWVLEVELEGSVGSNGMVLDFKLLKSAINSLVVDKLDHRLLNEVIVNPTCENLVGWIAEQIHSRYADVFVKLRRIRLYETTDSFAEEVLG